jgi:hypothetical protein
MANKASNTNKTPEEEAFKRWQRHEFLYLECQIAKVW